MDLIKRRLQKLTGDVLQHDDPQSDRYKELAEALKTLQELNKVWKLYEKYEDSVKDRRIKTKLDTLTREVLKDKTPVCEESVSKQGELKTLYDLIKTLVSFDGVDMQLDEPGFDDGDVRERKSTKVWDNENVIGSMSASVKLTERQRNAVILLDDEIHDKLLLLGGSGSGKTFVALYKVIRDALRYKAPCLVARDKFTDLTQGVIDQTVPAILQLIARQNGVDDWRSWTIDGLKFAKWTDKKSKLEFATGGYIRFAGLSARDLSDSGTDKILSPSWLHIVLEEASELWWDIVEKLITRLRHASDGVLNKIILTENPPSINHFTYTRWFEHKRTDGSKLSSQEIAQYAFLRMHPKDNIDNLGETYIRNLSQMSGANKERFYDGEFQDIEQGVILKKMRWTDQMPRPFDYDKLVIYTDPTPLTTSEHSIWADYKASVLVGLFDGCTFVIDVRLIKGSTTQLIQSMHQLYQASPNQSITEILMEKKQVPSDFSQVLQSYHAATGWLVPIRYDTRHFGEKKAAIEMFLEPVFEQESIFFNEAFRDTERGRQTQLQILKFSRKANKLIHDDIPDAIMKADTYLKGKKGKIRRDDQAPIVTFVKPAYINR